MCVSWINFKVVREVGWAPTPACAHRRAWRTWCDVLSDTTGVVWAWSACGAKRPIPCGSFISLAFSSSALQLDFLVSSCLDSTYRLVTGSELSGPQRVACSVFWEQHVGQLRLTGRFIFGEINWMIFTRRGKQWAFFIRKVRLELLRICLGSCIVLSKCSYYMSMTLTLCSNSPLTCSFSCVLGLCE